MYSKQSTLKGISTNTGNALKKYSIGDRGILDRKVKTNPKFNKIRSRTNSGFNAQRQQEIQKEINKYYKVYILSQIIQIMIYDNFLFIL